MASSVFATFKVDDKIEELKVLVGEKNFSVFEYKKVAIAVPVYDESMRNIQFFDHKLYISQQNDADQLRAFFIKSTETSVVYTVIKHDDIPHVRTIDYLILLHEFTQSEENNLIKALQDNGNEDFEVYKLY